MMCLYTLLNGEFGRKLTIDCPPVLAGPADDLMARLI